MNTLLSPPPTPALPKKKKKKRRCLVLHSEISSVRRLDAELATELNVGFFLGSCSCRNSFW